MNVDVEVWADATLITEAALNGRAEQMRRAVGRCKDPVGALHMVAENLLKLQSWLTVGMVQDFMGEMLQEQDQSLEALVTGLGVDVCGEPTDRG